MAVPCLCDLRWDTQVRRCSVEHFFRAKWVRVSIGTLAENTFMRMRMNNDQRDHFIGHTLEAWGWGGNEQRADGMEERKCLCYMLILE